MIAAQALAWPAEPDGGVEIGLESRPHERSTAREDREACLAAVIERSADGDVLLIDSHVTEELETAMMRDVPDPAPHPQDTWTAIVGIPVPCGPAPHPLRAELIPADADELAERLQG